MKSQEANQKVDDSITPDRDFADSVVRNIQKYVHNTLPQVLTMIIRNIETIQKVSPDGEPFWKERFCETTNSEVSFASFSDFLTTPSSEGLGLSTKSISLIQELLLSLRADHLKVGEVEAVTIQELTDFYVEALVAGNEEAWNCEFEEMLMDLKGEHVNAELRYCFLRSFSRFSDHIRMETVKRILEVLWKDFCASPLPQPCFPSGNPQDAATE
jgi:hypothetical protein